MAKKKTDQASASQGPEKKTLTWREEKFVEAYIRIGNGTAAAMEAGIPCPRQQASRLLSRVYIQDAIDEFKERDREILNFKREDALRILLGMALATPDDFADVLRNPSDRRNYKRLGYKKHALVSAEKSIKFGNSIKLADKRAALNDLWEKLGLDKDAGEGDRESFLERFAQLGSRLGRSGKDEGSK